MSFKLIVALLVVALTTAAYADLDANVFCFYCQGLRSGKNLWPVESDCHKFYQCFFLNATTATGIVRSCPNGTFYHDEIQGCMPEGPEPCKDRCRDDKVQAHGCYGVPGLCSTYFVCANTGSYQFCTPKGTRFDEATCSYLADETCTDACVLPSAPDQPQLPPLTIVNDGCIDSYGNKLSPHKNPKLYYVYDGANNQEMACAPGSQFVIAACRCDEDISATIDFAPYKMCDFYAPFDDDFEDHSPNKFWGNPFNAAIDKVVKARGTGSLRTSGGTSRVGYSGTRTFDFGNAASFCFYYQCAESGCDVSSSLLTNTNKPVDPECTLNLASFPNALFFGNVSFDRPLSSATIQNSVATSGFNQICVVFNGTHLELFVNNVAVQVKDLGHSAHLRISHCALLVGYGHSYGGFVGNIDEVLICRRALTPVEINAHYAGPQALRAEGMIP